MRNHRLAPLFALQRDRRRRWLAMALTAVVGLGLASLHWSGLLVGGALVGWTTPTLGRGVLAGLGFAALTLATFGLSLLVAGTLSGALSLGLISIVTGVIPLVLGPIGGASRGLVRNAPTDAAE